MITSQHDMLYDMYDILSVAHQVQQNEFQVSIWIL